VKPIPHIHGLCVLLPRLLLLFMLLLVRLLLSMLLLGCW
jgi:hypothetical protein